MSMAYLKTYLTLPTLVTGLFCLIFSGFFWAGTDMQRNFLYIGLPFFLTHAWLNRTNENIKEIFSHTLIFGLFCYLMINGFSIFWSENLQPEKLIQRSKMLLIFPVVLWVWYIALKSDEALWQKCMTAFVLSALVTAPIIVGTEYERILRGYRIHGFGKAENPNQAGLLYGIAFLWLLFCRKNMLLFNKLPTLLYWICVICAAAICLLAMSRGALIATIGTGILTLLVMLSCGHVKRLKKRYFILGIIFIGTLTALAMTNTGDFLSRGSSGRMEIWSQAIERASDQPLIGHGIATKILYPYTYNGTIKAKAGHPHNLYLATIVHTGLIGLIVFLGSLLSAIWLALKQASCNSRSYLIAISMGAILGLTDFGGYYTNLGNTWIVYWLPITALAAVTHSHLFLRREKSDSQSDKRNSHA